MRLYPRFTIRWLMVLVAIVGVLQWALEMRRRSAEFREREHRAWGTLMNQSGDNVHSPLTYPRYQYQSALFHKYHRAARYPWLSVTPDPPAPQ